MRVVVCNPLGLALLAGLLMPTLACDKGRSSLPSGETGGAQIPEPADLTRCEDAGLNWRSGNKTHFTSYPEPGSPECVEFNGCEWEGLFAGCGLKQSEEWVSQVNIAAVYPQFENLEHHELCIRFGSAMMIVNVIDTCSDTDCDGCCSQNLAGADALIDLEDYTDARWGQPDGEIQWADLGPRNSPVCN